ncbi:WecB/TagA/CpsF family glycosyltransferase [Patescibacteria group bacterium]|nr:WecB/TagA/CpsF family glycosyltransferase [Patescibacteria group bacterium]MBU1613266.1 WecB/TagA/CpsF family glycosyltransferase [Patescibacteria group bacterium]
MSKEILRIRIDGYDLSKAKQKIGEFLNSAKQFKVFTPNPEMLVKAQKDDYFKKVLNMGDMNICDGFGLWLIFRLSSRAKVRDATAEMAIERITGVDFMLDICKIAEENDKSIFLLGSGKSEVVEKTAEVLKKKFPNLKIVGTNKGPTIREGVQKSTIDNKLIIDDLQNYNTIAEINGAEPDILFVAFGMGKQEKWIYENLQKMPSVKIAMGVGGAFDYISGTVKRAPCWMCKIGLEWTYRLLNQPKRFIRIVNATAVFILLTIFDKNSR